MANLFWTHPGGDTRTTPCAHLVPQHPGGDTIMVPCTHAPVQQHPNGDIVKKGLVNVTVPCTHWVVPHPNGDAKTVPCKHLVPQHPAGDTITLPCAHPMAPVKIERGGALIFYTDNAELQGLVRSGLSLLEQLGANLLGTGPLNIFNREAINGNPNDNTDPFWSHYDPTSHAIQITKGRTGNALIDTLFHEMGHALVGRKCVQTLTPGLPHTMHTQSSQSEALSEGWAHFVGAAMMNAQSSINPLFKGENWENRRAGSTPDPAIEYSVAMCLWDLYDLNNDGNDNTRFSFRNLLNVFQPSFPTITSGPVMNSIFDFCERLSLNFPASREAIKQVRVKNIGS